MVKNNKFNKKGIIRIIEAVVASMIILTAVLLISTRAPVKTEKDLTGMIGPMLDELANNNTLREMILADTPDNNDAELAISSLVAGRIDSPSIGYNVTICKPEDPCPLMQQPYPGNTAVYSSDRIISSVLTEKEFNPKKVKIFLWIKN